MRDDEMKIHHSQKTNIFITAGGCWSAPLVTLAYAFHNMLLYLSHSYGQALSGCIIITAKHIIA